MVKTKKTNGILIIAENKGNKARMLYSPAKQTYEFAKAGEYSSANKPTKAVLKANMLNKILGIKKFDFYWLEENQCHIEIEAKDEKEARDKWENGDYNFNKVEKDCSGENEAESLEIVEQQHNHNKN